MCFNQNISAADQKDLLLIKRVIRASKSMSVNGNGPTAKT